MTTTAKISNYLLRGAALLAALALVLTFFAGRAVAQSTDPDGVPPTVASRSPQTTAGPNDNVTATFSEEMAPATIDASSFTLIREGEAGPVPAAVTFEGAPGNRATLDPSDALVEGGTYTANVSTGVTDASGTPLAAAETWTFTVADVTDPNLTIESGPSDGDTFGPNSTQTWTFSASDALSGVAAVECRVVPGPADGFVPCDGSYSVSNLSGGSHTFSVRAEDNAGNETVLTRVFSIDATPPTVALTAPEAGQRVRNSVNATATVADGDVAKVEFLVNGAVGATDTTAPYAATLDVSALVHGATPQVSVRATDNVGNVASSETRTITVDRDVSLTLGGTPSQGAFTNAASVPLQFTTDNDVPAKNRECRAYRTGTTPGTFANCASPFDPPLSADGGHTYEVRVTDDLGNTRTLSRSFTLDRTNPTLTIGQGPADGSVFGPNTTQTWTFQATDATSGPATVQCSVVAEGSAPSYGPCSTGTSHSVSGRPDGSYVFSVRAADGAGNTRELTRTFGIDAVAPTASLTAPGAGAKVGASMEVAATATDTVSAAPRVEFLVDGVVRATDDAAPYAATLNMAALAHGSAHTVAVRATDNVGNRSVLSERTVTVDLRTEVVLGETPAPDSFTNDPSPLSFTTDNDVVERECRATRAGTVAGAFAACPSPFAPELGQDGRYTYEVRVTDDVGNTDTKARAFTIDRTNPTLNLTGGPDGGTFGPNTRQAWAFTSGDATSGPATVECAVAPRTGTQPPSFAYGRCDAAGSHAVTNGPEDRTYQFSVRATDKARNQTVVTTAPIRIDAIRPTVNLTAPASGAKFGSTMTVSAIAADDLDVQRVRFLIDGTVRREVTVAPYAADLNVQTLAEGPHTVSARAVDGVGNTSTLSEATVTVDRQISLTLGGTPQQGSLNNAPRVPLPFTTDNDVPAENQRCQVRLGDAVVRPFEACVSPFDPDLTDDGIYTYDVQVRDEAGNPLTRSRTFTLDRTAPTLNLNGPEDGAVVGPNSNMIWSLIEKDATTGVSKVECGVAKVGTSPTFAECDVRDAPYTTSNTQRDGEYEFWARAVDGVGNTTEVVRRFTVDRTPPAVEITSDLADGASTNRSSVTYGFSSVEPDVKFECRLYREGTTPGSFGACSGPGNSHTESGLSPGRYVFEVRGLDRFGNRLDGPSAKRTFTVDVGAPRILAFAPKSRATAAPTANVVVTFSESMQGASLGRANFKLTRSGSVAPVAARLSLNPSANKATLNPAGSLRRGATYRVTVTAGARDLAGNALAVGKAWTFKVRG